MSGTTGATSRVTVIGGGVVGWATALELSRAGLRVELVAGGPEPSASAAAAGMLAPASEALLDGMDKAAAAALLRARARWDVWAPRLGLRLDTHGALHLAAAQVLDAREASAARLGLRAVRRDGGLWLPEDALLEPAAALRTLSAAAVEAGVVARPGRVEVRDGLLHRTASPLEGEVVVAAGWGSAALADAAPELGALRPIKGQLLRIAAPPGRGPTLRTADAYLAPGSHGWTVGATMEPGRVDLAVDPAASQRLRDAASRVRPELEVGEALPAVGIRAATPDGLPLVGRSRSGPWLASGMRRNGWLLAPLVAEGIAALLTGRDPAAVLAGQAEAWSPARLTVRDS